MAILFFVYILPKSSSGKTNIANKQNNKLLKFFINQSLIFKRDESSSGFFVKFSFLLEGYFGAIYWYFCWKYIDLFNCNRLLKLVFSYFLSDCCGGKNQQNTPAQKSPPNKDTYFLCIQWWYRVMNGEFHM